MLSAFELIPLSIKQKNQIDHDYKSWPDRIPEVVRVIQAQQWKATQLFVVGAIYGKPWNCCQTGHVALRRIDNLPITQDDIDAINALDYGQENECIGKVGDLTVVHRWLCDSSD